MDLRKEMHDVVKEQNIGNKDLENIFKIPFTEIEGFLSGKIELTVSFLVKFCEYFQCSLPLSSLTYISYNDVELTRLMDENAWLRNRLIELQERIIYHNSKNPSEAMLIPQSEPYEEMKRELPYLLKEFNLKNNKDIKQWVKECLKNYD